MLPIVLLAIAFVPMVFEAQRSSVTTGRSGGGRSRAAR
jgi:hypothetical protein